jgi:hypothetical protein
LDIFYFTLHPRLKPLQALVVAIVHLMWGYSVPLLISSLITFIQMGDLELFKLYVMGERFFLYLIHPSAPQAWTHWSTRPLLGPLPPRLGLMRGECSVSLPNKPKMPRRKCNEQMLEILCSEAVISLFSREKRDSGTPENPLSTFFSVLHKSLPIPFHVFPLPHLACAASVDFSSTSGG